MLQILLIIHETLYDKTFFSGHKQVMKFHHRNRFALGSQMNTIEHESEAWMLYQLQDYLFV